MLFITKGDTYKVKSMRWLTLLCLIITACSSPNGDQNNSDAEADADPNALHIHFQGGFYQDTVTLFHGKEKIYEKVLTTPDGQKVTDKFSIPKSDIKDTLHFRVATEKEKLKGFIPPNAEQYVGFYLSSGSVVNVYSKEEPFEYK